ncbi:MAG: FCD domain-containing protein, partial [Achromobacter spanius]
HHRILDAIADGDGELAEILMRRHIRASRINIEQQIAQSTLQRTEA